MAMQVLVRVVNIPTFISRRLAVSLLPMPNVFAVERKLVLKAVSKYYVITYLAMFKLSLLVTMPSKLASRTAS